MIKLIEEESQKIYNITNGCTNCGINDLKNDIKIIQITPKFGGRGLEINLCNKCRKELFELLGMEK